jgi:hypothetical protein
LTTDIGLTFDDFKDLVDKPLEQEKELYTALFF